LSGNELRIAPPASSVELQLDRLVVGIAFIRYCWRTTLFAR